MVLLPPATAMYLSGANADSILVSIYSAVHSSQHSRQRSMLGTCLRLLACSNANAWRTSCSTAGCATAPRSVSSSSATSRRGRKASIDSKVFIGYAARAVYASLRTCTETKPAPAQKPQGMPQVYSAHAHTSMRENRMCAHVHVAVLCRRPKQINDSPSTLRV